MAEIVIKNLPLVAALRISGIDPHSSGKDGAGRCFFIYQRTPQLTTLVNGYYSGELSLPARPFADALYQCKKDYMPR